MPSTSTPPTDPEYSSSAGPLSPALLAWSGLLLAAVAVLVRVPECGESFWVDELHSAWTVWGRWDQVAERAAAGNQTPWYFWMLWLWKQAWGGSELMLRLPSVLAVAASCGVLMVAAARSSGRWFVGVIAGGLLAVDLNAIYFGTETRSYSFVMLFTTLAAWSGVEHSDPRNRRRWCSRWRWLLWASLFSALLMHPTAGLSLAVFVMLGFIWSRLNPAALAWSWGDLAGSFVAGLLAMLINGLVVKQVWNARHNWTQFGVPHSVGDLWTMWPWLIALVPLALLGVARLVDRSMPSDTSIGSVLRQRISVWPLLLPVVLLATGGCWLLASYGDVPLWHRRYIVGLLPWLCWGTADIWASMRHRLPACESRNTSWKLMPLGAVILSIGGLMILQQTPKIWIDSRVVLRSEDWRGAVDWIEQQRTPGDAVFVGAELIESNQLVAVDATQPDYEPLRRYLLFPVSGPYLIEHAQPLAPAQDAMRQELRDRLPKSNEQAGNARVQWWLYRVPEQSLNQLYSHANDPTLACPAVEYTDGTAQAFGTLTVVRMVTRWPDR